MAARFLAALLLFPGSLQASDPVSFRREIAPLVQRRCGNCHNEENPKGGYRVDTPARLRTAGDSGEAPIRAAQTQKSLFFKLLITKDTDERMPQKAEALPVEEVALIERWIQEGAAMDADRDDQPLAELARERHLAPAPAHYARPVPVIAMVFDPSGRRLATNGYREVLIWDAASGALVRRVGGLPERINALAWHGSHLAVAGGTPGQWGTVALVDTASDFRVRLLGDLPEMALCVALSPDGASLVAGCGDRTLRIFNVADGAQRKVLRHHADWVQSVAFSPSGQRLVSASRDRTARVIDTASWEIEGTYDDHDTAILAAAFTPDNLRIVTAARGGVAHLWHPDLAQRRGEWTELGGDVRQLVPGAFGIAAGGFDGTVRLYQNGQKTPWLELTGHRDTVESLAVSRRSEWLASGSADGQVIIWSPQCWEAVTRFQVKP